MHCRFNSRFPVAAAAAAVVVVVAAVAFGAAENMEFQNDAQRRPLSAKRSIIVHRKSNMTHI